MARHGNRCVFEYTTETERFWCVCASLLEPKVVHKPCNLHMVFWCSVVLHAAKLPCSVICTECATVKLCFVNKISLYPVVFLDHISLVRHYSVWSSMHAVCHKVAKSYTYTMPFDSVIRHNWPCYSVTIDSRPLPEVV